MGVLNKLKSRMSSYHGPTQVDPNQSSPVYGFDTGRKPSSGVEAVNAGLAAAANQVVSQSTVGQDIANLGSTIGKAIGTAYGKDKENKRPNIKSTTLESDGYSTNLVGNVATEKINTGIKSPFGITTTAKDELNKIKVDLPTQMLKPKK